MIALLGFLLDGVELIGSYVLWAGESLVNGGLAALAAAYGAAVALLPSMPNPPNLGGATWLSWLSWLYPIGDLLAGLTLCVTMWITFLAVRYVLRLVRGL